MSAAANLRGSSPPTAPATASTAYRARLARMRSAWSSGSLGSLPSALWRSRQPLPRPPHEAHEVAVRRRRGRRSHAGRHRALHEPVDEVEIAGGAQRGDHAHLRRVVLVERGGEQQLRVALDLGTSRRAPCRADARAAPRLRGRRRARRPASASLPTRVSPTPRRATGRTCAGRCATAWSPRGPGARLPGRCRRARPGRRRGAAAPTRRARRG